MGERSAGLASGTVSWLISGFLIEDLQYVTSLPSKHYLKLFSDILCRETCVDGDQ